MNVRPVLGPLPLVLGLLLLFGCGADPSKLKDEAQEALGQGDYGRALQVTQQALERADPSDERLVWSLERIRLEALARSNDGPAAVRTLERLAVEHPQQTNPSLYLAIASYVREAGDTSAAIDVLVAGDERFPAASEQFQEAIRRLKESGLDPAEVERLKSLGYL